MFFFHWAMEMRSVLYFYLYKISSVLPKQIKPSWRHPKMTQRDTQLQQVSLKLKRSSLTKTNWKGQPKNKKCWNWIIRWQQKNNNNNNSTNQIPKLWFKVLCQKVSIFELSSAEKKNQSIISRTKYLYINQNKKSFHITNRQILLSLLLLLLFFIHQFTHHIKGSRKSTPKLTKSTIFWTFFAQIKQPKIYLKKEKERKEILLSTTNHRQLWCTFPWTTGSSSWVSPWPCLPWRRPYS